MLCHFFTNTSYLLANSGNLAAFLSILIHNNGIDGEYNCVGGCAMYPRFMISETALSNCDELEIGMISTYILNNKNILIYIIHTYIHESSMHFMHTP